MKTTATKFEKAARKVELMIAKLPGGSEQDVVVCSGAWQRLSHIPEIRGCVAAFARIAELGAMFRAAKEARLENEAIARYFELKSLNTACMEKALRAGR